MTPIEPAVILKSLGGLISTLAGAFVAASARLAGVAIPEALAVGMTIGGGTLLIVWRGVRILSSAAAHGDRLNRQTIARLQADLDDAREHIRRLEERS